MLVRPFKVVERQPRRGVEMVPFDVDPSQISLED